MTATDAAKRRMMPRGPLPAEGARAIPAEARQQLLDAIYSGQPFRRVLSDLDLTSNQVCGLARTDPEWSEQLEAALTETRRDDLQRGTNAAMWAAVCVGSVGSTNAFGWPGMADRVTLPRANRIGVTMRR